MKYITKIIIFTLVVFFINCKEKPKISDIKSKDPEYTINESVNDTNVKSVEETNIPITDNKNMLDTNSWSFYKVSASSITRNPTKSESEITNQFKNVKIEIGNKTLKVGDFCSYEFYKSDKSPIEYFQSKKTTMFYENVFKKNGLKLEKLIKVYQPLYPEKSCESPWDELFFSDNTLIIVFNDYLVFFKKDNFTSNKQNDCYSKTKTTNLPITKSVIHGSNVWNELDCNIGNLETKDYLRLPDINDVKIFIIGNFNYDDFTYTLVTLKNNKVVTTKKVGFAEGGEDGNTISKFTEFEISKDFVFNLNTKSSKDGVFKTIKQEKFKIDQNGLLVGVK